MYFKPISTTPFSCFNLIPLSARSVTVSFGFITFLLPSALPVFVGIPGLTPTSSVQPGIVSFPLRSIFEPSMPYLIVFPSRSTVRPLLASATSKVISGAVSPLREIVSPTASPPFLMINPRLSLVSYFVFTVFSCATLTASVSCVPAATPVIWRVIPLETSPTETAAAVAFQVPIIRFLSPRAELYFVSASV